MSLPFFFEEKLTGDDIANLSESTSKHITQVLRMRNAEKLQLTDGKGKLFTAEIISGSKKSIQVKIISRNTIGPAANKVTIAVSLLKNNNRFEWFIEKATEIGVSKIIPLICERTEKQHFRYDRMNAIIISALLQSQQVWLPILSEPIKFGDLIRQSFHHQKYIAHCVQTEQQQLIGKIKEQDEHLILIGPEGDFTPGEIDSALKNKFISVTLGRNRLRTETAAIVACILLNQ